MIDINLKEAKDNLQKFIENILTTNKGNFRVQPPTYAMSHWRISITKVHRLFEFRVNDKNYQHVDIQEIVRGLDPGTIRYGKTVTVSDMSSIKTENDILKLFTDFEFEGKFYNHSDIDRLLSNLNMIKQCIEDV